MALISYRHLEEVLEDLKNKIKENFVEHWGNLKYTSGYKYENLLDYDSRVQGKFFPNNGSGDVQDAWHWSIFHCPVKPNEEYTVLRKFGDSGRYVFYNQQGNVVEVLEVNMKNDINDWHRNFVKVPDNPDIAHMAFCFQTYRDDLNVKGRIMLLKESNVREELDFIPYSNGSMVVVDADKVAMQFNNSGTSLQSNNLVGAIKELDGKIVNAGGGTVTSVNNQQPNGQGNVTVDATHIKLDGQNSQTVKQEFDTLNGRVDNCVIRVNGQTPAQGNVTINGTHINATVGGTNTTIQDHLTTINNNLTTAGNSIRANSLKANNNENRILLLERKHPVYHVGDIITTTYKTNDTYIADDFEFLYVGGSRKLINRDKYSDLFDALGVSASVNSIYTPEISDINLTYNINQTAKRRHYICARKVR